MAAAAARAREARDDVAAMDVPGLVAAARRRDEAAIRELVRRHNQRLFRAARSVLRSDAEAEDVVQASYVKAFTHLDQFRAEAGFATWLTRIALNEALERLRRRRPSLDLESFEAAESSIIAFPLGQTPDDPEVAVSRQQLRHLLEAAIDDLPAAFRAVFVLRDVEGLSIEETAEQLGIRPETVKTRLHRARTRLRHALSATIGGAFADLYPFDGARCAAMGDRVVAGLGRARRAG